MGSVNILPTQYAGCLSAPSDQSETCVIKIQLFAVPEYYSKAPAKMQGLFVLFIRFSASFPVVSGGRFSLCCFLVRVSKSDYPLLRCLS